MIPMFRATATGGPNPQNSFKISPELNMFFAQRDIFVSELKRAVQPTKGYDVAIESIVVSIVDQLFKDSYMKLQRKEKLIKGLAVCLYLIDNEGEEPDVFKRKRLKMDRVEEVFQVRILSCWY